ncbi:MAG: tRNA (guanosine(37)-N1)-methyltransferase TrmD [Holosporaceae bacterium]|jgi:tRNA (guanine37-N1)-methyltransferase|nr:tRNA (guanosine(37)-N1)-methyltransferase TrmD [Holosporaceae bacterium]
MWQANVFTIFPDAFPGTLGVSVIGKALEQKKWNLNLIDLKKFPVKSDRIDSPPYGGGEGMILSPAVFERAFQTLSSEMRKWKKIYFSPRGRRLRQSDFEELARLPGITMLCGRYEGVDQRIIDFYETEEISVGDFVLPGGETAAMIVAEGCVRLLPEVVGNGDSLRNDSFQNFLLEYDQYTKPEIFNALSTPEILLSGDHRKIAEFRLNQSKKITAERRPDLWAEYIDKMLSGK